MGTPVLDGPIPHAVEQVQLSRSPDERRLRGRPGSRGLEGLDDGPRGHRGGLPLCLDGGDRLETESVPRQPVRLLADDQIPGRSGVLQAGGRVHDVAGR